MPHYEFLQRRFRTRWQGYDPEDVQAAIRDAESRQHELEQEVHDQSQELERLRAEVGRAYTTEASIAQAIVTAQQVGATLKDQAAAEAEALRARAESEATRIIREAREEARVLVEHATGDARGLVRDAETTVVRLSSARYHLESDLRAVAAAGLDLAQGLVVRLQALQGLDLPEASALDLGALLPNASLPTETAGGGLEPALTAWAPEFPDVPEEHGSPDARDAEMPALEPEEPAGSPPEVPLFLLDPTGAVADSPSDVERTPSDSRADAEAPAVDEDTPDDPAVAADGASAVALSEAPPGTPWAAPLSEDAQARLRDLFDGGAAETPSPDDSGVRDGDGLVVGGAGLRGRSVAGRVLGFLRKPLR